jgi:hypothetical protein
MSRPLLKRRRRRRSKGEGVTSRPWKRALLAGASFLIAMWAAATPQVVGDDACERYEVDMASFASCTDGKVVRPARDTADIAIVAAEERSRYAGYFAPEAHHRARYLLAAFVPGFDVAPGMRERPEHSPFCTPAP